jgi:hypothetical protein
MGRLEELEERVAQLQHELSELVRLGASDARVDLLAARIAELERRTDHLEGDARNASRAEHPTARAMRRR